MSNEPSASLSTLPNDWWRQLSTCKILVDWFRCHLVGLFFSIQTEDHRQHVVFTGFLLYYKQILLWITAGHVIDKTREILSDRKTNVKVMRWLDCSQIPGAESIPVHNRNLQMFSATQNGIDFGAVAITGLDAENMLRNRRVEPITEQIWKDIHLAKPEGYYVIGYPEIWQDHKVELLPDNRVLHSFGATVACLPVSRIKYQGSSRANREFWNAPEAFYGQILPFVEGPEYQPESIVGMSGGPLFSVERDPLERIRYRLFGIQRSWDRDERLIRAEPIHKIIGLIKI